MIANGKALWIEIERINFRKLTKHVDLVIS